MTKEQLQEFIFKKRFNTRGLPFAKKMWRDGYNKALEDVLNHLLQLEQEKPPQANSSEHL